MDRNQLEEKLITFCEAAKIANMPIIIEGTSMAYPGVNDTSFTVHARGQEWADNLSCSEMLEVLVPILFESTEKESRRVIFALNVYNKNGNMNCHHILSYEKYEMACL